MTKSTPGPWEVGNEDETGGVPFIQIETDVRAICEVSSSAVGEFASEFEITDEDRANGRLIAAAPDLLAALKRVTGAYITLVNPGGLIPIDELSPITEALNAIAKAEGRDR